MSSRNIQRDERTMAPLNSWGSSPGLYGRKFWLISTGTNQSNWDVPLEQHGYSLNYGDDCTMLYKQCRGKPANTNTWSVALPTGTQLRPWDGRDDMELYGKLEEKYDKGDFNAGVFVGELGKTVDLLASRTVQLFRAVRAAKRGNFDRAAKILRATPPQGGRRKHPDKAGLQADQKVSSAWLELQYGWIPLCKDIYSMSKQIVNMDKPRKRRLYVNKYIGWNADTHPNFTITGTGRTGKQIIAYVTEDIPSWPEALGLMDPELVAWELVPFSFVADWFIPVGNWLQARAFASRAKGEFVITSYTRFAWRIGESKRISFSDGTSCSSIPQNLGWSRKMALTRTVVNSLPQIPLPSFQNGIGRGWRLQNAVALAASIFGGTTYRP